jgi:tetratricopeptide (TPR) repeat protein
MLPRIKRGVDEAKEVFPMAWYVYDPRLPYVDWLRLSKQHEIADRAATKNAELIVGSMEDLTKNLRNQTDSILADAMTAFQSLESQLSSGLSDISGRLDSISVSIEAFRSDFNWHMQEINSSLASIGRVLEDIRETLSRKHRSEAFEFFQQSLEYAHHRRFDKAIRSIEIAIHGDHQTRGYDLEWRFWEQLGRLRLGSNENNSREIVDLRKAEEAFLEGARLAERGAPDGAARCLLGAAWAAYADGRIPTAVGHARQAIHQSPNLAEAHWQLARHLLVSGQRDQAEEGFFRALRLDPTYEKRVKEDLSALLTEGEFNRLVGSLTARFRAGVALDAQLASLRARLEAGRFGNPEAWRLKAELDRLSELSRSTKLLDAIFIASQGNKILERLITAVSGLVEQEQQSIHREIERLRSVLASGATERLRALLIGAYFFCSVAVLILTPVYEDDPSTLGIILAVLLSPIALAVSVAGAGSLPLTLRVVVFGVLALVVAGALTVDYALYGYRIGQMRRRLAELQLSLDAFSSRFGRQ